MADEVVAEAPAPGPEAVLCLHCLKEVRTGSNFIFVGFNQVHQDCYPAYEKAQKDATPAPPVEESTSDVGGVAVTTGVTDAPPPASPEPVPAEPAQPFPSLTQPDPPSEG